MTTSSYNTLEIRRADSRGETRLDWLDSAHSFSFGYYHDPQRMGFRSLRVINDDRIAPGAGFGEHGHDNMEIISWVLDGGLRHGDSLENSQQLSPGEVQVMSAGAGVRHSEFNASATDPAHFIQIWIEPRERNIKPRYGQTFIPAEARRNQFAPIASGDEAHVLAGALPIYQDATVFVADVDDVGGQARYTVQAERGVYVHVGTGEIELDFDSEGYTLAAGDAAVIAPGKIAGEIVVKGVETSQVLLFDLG